MMPPPPGPGRPADALLMAQGRPSHPHLHIHAEREGLRMFHHSDVTREAWERGKGLRLMSMGECIAWAAILGALVLLT